MPVISIVEDQDGWQKPVGLTAEAAIQIDDDDGESDVDDSGQDTSSSTKATTCRSNADANAKAGATSKEVPVSEKGPESQAKKHVSDINNTEERVLERDPEPSNEMSPNTLFAADAISNPFAAFAFSSSGDDDHTSSSSVSIPTNINIAANNRRYKRPAPLSVNGQKARKPSKGNKEKNIKKRRKTTTKNKCDDYVPVQQLPVDEQERIRVKWQGLADPHAPLEVRRFQVLVAARLHAQSKEPIVKAAMDNLRKHFSDTSNNAEEVDEVMACLCAKSLSRADPKVIALLIPSVLFANTKSDHIVKAASEVCSRFGGIVPQSRHGLMELTGIGPKLADILHFANSRTSYEHTESF